MEQKLRGYPAYLDYLRRLAGGEPRAFLTEELPDSGLCENCGASPTDAFRFVNPARYTAENPAYGRATVYLCTACRTKADKLLRVLPGFRDDLHDAVEAPLGGVDSGELPNPDEAREHFLYRLRWACERPDADWAAEMEGEDRAWENGE